jgi:hypothetical protein
MASGWFKMLTHHRLVLMFQNFIFYIVIKKQELGVSSIFIAHNFLILKNYCQRKCSTNLWNKHFMLLLHGVRREADPLDSHKEQPDRVPIRHKSESGNCSAFPE